MSSYGFVYMLVNDYMSCFKIGCTERSPHLRAEEISGSTGVPSAFKVACYIEVRAFQEVERTFHEMLGTWRVSQNREFFEDSAKAYAFRLLRWYPESLAFTLVREGEWYGADDHRLEDQSFALNDIRSSPYPCHAEDREDAQRVADLRAAEERRQATLSMVVAQAPSGAE